MNMKRPEIQYHYRGRDERISQFGTRCRWVETYSEQGEHGPVYPWMSRRECQADAKRRGARAVFTRQGVTR